MTAASTETRRFLRALSDRLSSAGIDRVHPFTVESSLDELFPLPRFDHDTRLGVLIANTKALWAPFVRWCREQPRTEHPLHAYIERHIPGAVQRQRSAIFYAHRTDYVAFGKRTAVPIQRLGQAVGFASLGPAHLSVHREAGPWIAYRAVLVVDLPPLYTPNRALTEPCQSCSAPCHDVLQGLLSRSQSLQVASRWREWLSVREACPEGKAFRYSEEQLRYHYAKDPDALLTSEDPEPQ